MTTSDGRGGLQVRAAVSVLIIVVCLGFLLWMLYPILPLVLQWLAVIGILIAFRCWPPMAGLFRAMPAPHRWVFALILASFLLGHLTIRPRTWYPFFTWAIFPAPVYADPVTCRQFQATTESGKKVRLLVEQLFPSIIQIDSLETFDNPDAYPPGTTDKLAAALVRQYNKLHADDPVRQVDLVLVGVHLHPAADGAPVEPSCQPLKHYDFSSAPAN
jgi:hypothetical protein